MSRVKVLGVLLAVLIFSVTLAQSMVYLDRANRVDETQYDFIIIIHNDGLFNSNTVYYSDDPPMYGSNCVMFIDATTGFIVVEIAPRITARSTVPNTEIRGTTEKKRPRGYSICKR